GLAVFHYTTLFRSISRKALTSVPVWPKDQMVKATAVAAVISPAPRCQLRSGPRKPVGTAASVVFWAGVPGIVEIPRSEEEGRPETCVRSGSPDRAAATVGREVTAGRTSGELRSTSQRRGLRSARVERARSRAPEDP